MLERIPDDIRRDRRTQKVLKKLERFARNPDLRIRPPTFLKVLGELRIWEICSPDICAAVEVRDVGGKEFSCFGLKEAKIQCYLLNPLRVHF